jgi:hypothetical protein
VPYGWQFGDEEVCIEAAKGKGLNCFALVSRNNSLRYETSRESITADFIVEQLDRLSLSVAKQTVVVLDNARVHTAGKVNKLLDIWQLRELFIFFPANLLAPPQHCRKALEGA